MGVSLDLVDFDVEIKNCQRQPIILNDHLGATEEERLMIENNTRTVFDSQSVFSNTPSCACNGENKLFGRHRLGKICSNCNTPVVDVHSTELDPIVWIRSPKGVAKLINPAYWVMLSNRFQKKDFNFIEWLTNTDYVYRGQRPDAEIQEMLDMGMVRGYNNFIEHFEEYLDKLHRISYFYKKRLDGALWDLVKFYPTQVFITYVPLINKSMLIIEDTAFARYMDLKNEEIFNVINNMQGIDCDVNNYTLRQRENKTAKSLARIAAFCYEATHSQLARKPGLFRKHTLGSRFFFSCRAVISSKTGVHKYDELDLAWSQAIALLELKLVNKLLKRGYSANEADGLIRAHTYRFHPLIKTLFEEIIRETNGGRGLIGVYVRNPSLTKSSTCLFRIVKIKDDPLDFTNSLPITATVLFNADFDGDAMAFMLMPDNFMIRLTESLAIHKNTIEPNKPRTLTPNASIPKPVMSTFLNWLSGNGRKKDFTQEDLAFAMSLAD